MDETARTWAEVDLDAVAHNLAVARRLLPPGVKTACVLKADAYGLGAAAVAGVLLEGGADMLAVACVPEALELRRLYPDARLLVLGHTPDGWLPDALAADITLAIGSLAQAQAVSLAAQAAGAAARVHIQVDTGFHRLGVPAGPGAADEIARMTACPGLVAEGIFTHLALTSQPEDERQFALFTALTDELARRGIRFPLRHVCDSIGMVRYPQYRLDMVRPGAFLYGVRPSRFTDPAVTLTMPLAFKTRLSRVADIEKGGGVSYDYTYTAPRSGRVGTLAAGYVDGYPRCLSNRAQVLVRGRRAPVVGLICMDQCMIDLTDIPEAQPGDEVLLFGHSSQGDIPLEEVAGWAGTNRNEILSGIGRRVPRVYRRHGRPAGTADYLLGGSCPPAKEGKSE